MEYKFDRIVYCKLDDSEKNRKLQILKNLFQKNECIKLAYLFGSITRRNRVRDIDVAIYSAPILEFEEFLKLGAKLELELKIPLDLVQIQELKPTFRYKILRFGQPIIIKDKKLHNSLISQALSEINALKIMKKQIQIKGTT